jgi:putative transposase
MVNKIRIQKRMHLKSFDYTGNGHVYFITICTAARMPYFNEHQIAEMIVDEMEFRRGAKEIRLFCYCIMPDHIHMLLSLTKEYQKSLINWVSAFKRYSTRNINGSYGINPLWQKNFYDHVVRKEESLINVAEYILNNPVRKGIARVWEEYPYSRMVDPLPL